MEYRSFGLNIVLRGVLAIVVMAVAITLLEITFQAARYEDYRYKLSTQTMEDNGIYSFALAHKDEVRILIATVSYNDNCLELDETKIDEIIISRSEIHSMICELDSYYKRTINNKRY